MVYLEHKYNNPLALVFRESIRREIFLNQSQSPEQQAIRNLRNKILQTILLNKNLLLQRQTKMFIYALQKQKMDFIIRTKEEFSMISATDFKLFKEIRKAKLKKEKKSQNVEVESLNLNT